MKQINNYILEKLHISKDLKINKYLDDVTSSKFKEDVETLIDSFCHDMSIPNKYQIKYVRNQGHVYFRNKPIQFKEFRDKLNKFCIDSLDLGTYKTIKGYRIPPVNPGKYMVVFNEEDK